MLIYLSFLEIFCTQKQAIVIMSSFLVKPKKSVLFVGPGSTGKTTLAAAVKEMCTCDTYIIQEVARSVLRKVEYNATYAFSNPENCFDLQKLIFLAQCQAETNLWEKNFKYISDRSAIDPIVYAKFYIKSDAFKDLTNLDEWSLMKEKYQMEEKVLIVLIEPSETFLKADGTRKMPTDYKEWILFYNEFISFMNENDIPFKIIPCSMTSIQHRTAKVIEWMET